MDLAQPHPELIGFDDLLGWVATVMAAHKDDANLRRGSGPGLVLSTRLAIPEVELVEFTAAIQLKDPAQHPDLLLSDVSCLCVRYQDRLLTRSGETSMAIVRRHLHQKMCVQVGNDDGPDLVPQGEFRLGPVQATLPPLDGASFDHVASRFAVISRDLAALRAAHLQGLHLDRTTPQAELTRLARRI